MMNNIRRKIVKRWQVDTYESSEEEITRIFKEAGLEVNIVPFKFGLIKSHMIKHIIAYKKNTKNEINIV